MGAESEERPKQVVCYRARMRLGGGGGGGGAGFGGWRERWRSTVSLPA